MFFLSVLQLLKLLKMSDNSSAPFLFVIWEKVILTSCLLVLILQNWLDTYLWHSQVFLVLGVATLNISNYYNEYVSHDVKPILISMSCIVEFYNYWILSKMLDSEMLKRLVVYCFLVLNKVFMLHKV